MAKGNNKQKKEEEKKVIMQEEEESDEEMDDDEEDDDDMDGFPSDYTGTSFTGFLVEKGAKGYTYEFDDDLKGDALLITQACLGSDAKKGDHAVLSITIGESTYVVAHLSYDCLPHVSLDLAIEQDVTFTVSGDCGVHVSGRKVFDSEDDGADYEGMDGFGEEDEEDEDDEDDEEEEDDDEEEEEEEVNDKKRKQEKEEKKDDKAAKKQKGEDGAAKPKQAPATPAAGKDKQKESQPKSDKKDAKDLPKVSEDDVVKALVEVISGTADKKMNLSQVADALQKKFDRPFKLLGLPQKNFKSFIEGNKKFQINGNDVKLA